MPVREYDSGAIGHVSVVGVSSVKLGYNSLGGRPAIL